MSTLRTVAGKNSRLVYFTTSIEYADSYEANRGGCGGSAPSGASNFQPLEHVTCHTLEHENTLRTRWIKKSREQRTKILLTAWPNMASSHRPDMHAVSRET